MHPKRHLFRTLAAAGIVAAGLTSAATTAFAQDWPSRPILMLVPAAPGGTTDLSARLLAEPLAAALDNPVVVENRPGANGSIATGAVKRAAPDGYTVLLQYSGYHVITPAIVSNLGWDPITDFVAVANVISAPQLVVVRDGLPVKTLPELIAYAKANPGKLSYASSGNGSLQHVTGELLKQLAGIEMTHVPYKGTGPAINDLIGGSVDLTFGTPPPYMGHIESGRLRPLAVTGPQRLPSLPDTPTAAEAGLPKLDASSWFGMFAPRGTPPAVVERLTSEIAKIVRDPEFVKKAELQGATASYMDPQEFAAFTKAELERWATVIKSAGIKAD